MKTVTSNKCSVNLATARTPSQSARGLAQSKTWWRFMASLLFVATATITHPQSYSIDCFKTAGGGGASSGGPMIGSNYSVTGGFWALPTVVQVTKAPTLTIVPATPGNATNSWTPNTPGFVLQETLCLSPTNWMYSASGANNPIVVPTTNPAMFYRLFKP